jgi:hypothetical protein
LGSRLILASALIWSAVSTACRPTPSSGAAQLADSSIPLAREGGQPTQALLEYQIDGHRIALTLRDGACFVSAKSPANQNSTTLLRLGMRPPCFFVTWRQPAPTERPSGATPVGDVGNPMAWRFAGPASVTVLAFIGEPVSEQQWAKRPKLRGAQCGSRTQGLRLHDGKAELTKRILEGFACIERGLDEKDFWLFAHET